MDKSVKIEFLLPLIGLLAITTALLTGCGFHLRGNVTLPEGMSSLKIKAPTYLSNKLVMLLESSGITTTSDEKGADAILIVESERFRTRTLSVDSETGKERERELSYTIVYQVITPTNEELLPKQTINLIRDYVFDERAVLGTAREQHVLHEEMRRDAIHQILRRLKTWRP